MSSGSSSGGWQAKRFWTEAKVRPVETGFAIDLDTRAVKTPAKRPLVVPTEALARAIAAEWDAQEEKIDPVSMPLTRAANAALDKVALEPGALVEGLAAYGETDLLCHRAESPAELVERQARAWDPILDWAERVHGARLKVGAGVMPIAQPPEALERLRTPLEAADPFALTALSELVSLSGSLVIGLAAAADAWPPTALWDISRLDAIWQAERWGRDEEAEAQAAMHRAAFLNAHRFHTLSRAAAAG